MIFSENPDDFRYGRWVGNLNHELAPSRLREHLKEKRDVDVIPDSNWYRRPRFWRATGEQWLQFERKDLGRKYPDDEEGSGFFWSGKPAVLPSQSALYAGYYVERGFPQGVASPEQIKLGQEIGPTWHWNAFYPMLSEEPLDNRLVKLLNSLPAERRFIWVWDSTAREGKPFPLKELSTDVLQGVTRYIDDEVGQAHWIDLVAGVQYTFNECVQGQEKIIPGVVSALRTGFELYRLVNEYY